MTMTCEPMLVTGLRSMGFIRTEGSLPAASACTTWARPISRPSLVMKELRAMFWLLKGATRYPSCMNTLHRPAATRLFPALDMVPCIIIALAIGFLRRFRAV